MHMSASISPHPPKKGLHICKDFPSGPWLHTSVFGRKAVTLWVQWCSPWKEKPMKCQWVSWRECTIMPRWMSVYWFRILRANYALDSAMSAVPPFPCPPPALPPTYTLSLHPHPHPQPRAWNSNCKATELWIGSEIPPFHSGETHKSSVFSAWQSYFCAS
jgi:hypothetical protein